MKLNISESIRKLRCEADMTQDAVAEALGVTYQAVSRWENGKSYPDIELLPALAALFGVDMDRLFGMDTENEEANTEKYDREDAMLTDDEERIAHTKKYIDAFPRSVYFKMRLLELYCAKGVEYTNDRLHEMRRLCQFVVDNTGDSDGVRTNALISMINAEDDDNVDIWLTLLDRKSMVNSVYALRERYDYRNEVDKYNQLTQKDLYISLRNCFESNFCKRDKINYKDARSRMEGQRVIMSIIDTLRDTGTDEDAWIEDRIFAHVRLAAGCFGCGEKDAGYAALDKCVELVTLYCSKIFKGRKLVFNSPVLDEVTKEITSDAFIEYNVINPLTTDIGWEWFNIVREEERYRNIVAIVEEMFSKRVGNTLAK